MSLIDVTEFDFAGMLPNQRMELLRNFVCELYGITEEKLLSKSRRESLDFPRKVFSLVAYKKCQATQYETAKAIGRKEHSSIHHSLNVTRDLIDIDNDKFSPYWTKFVQNAPSYLIP